jgi:mRNA interferase MazF
MMQYKFGDIVLVRFPQTGMDTRKKRPALVLLDIGDADLVLAPITTRERFGAGDIKLTRWGDAGLLRESWVRLAKVACLPKGDVVRLFGRLAEADRAATIENWKRLYALPGP